MFQVRRYVNAVEGDDPSSAEAVAIKKTRKRTLNDKFQLHKSWREFVFSEQNQPDHFDRLKRKGDDDEPILEDYNHLQRKMPV
jgi:hypothetical protein